MDEDFIKNFTINSFESLKLKGYEFKGSLSKGNFKNCTITLIFSED